MPRALRLSQRDRRYGGEGGGRQKERTTVETTLATVPVAEEAEPVTQKAKRQRRAPLTLQEEMALMVEWAALPCGPSGCRKVGVHELEARWGLADDHIRKNLLPRYTNLEPGQMPKPRTLPGWTQSNKGVARKLLPSVMAEVEAKGDEWRNEWNFDEMAEWINKSGLLREGLSISASGLRQRCHAEGWDVWARPDQVPALSEQQMIDRMLFAFIYRNEDFRYWFDIDEKWFLCARLHARVKLGPGQKKPKRKAKNKKHLPKVMVLAGVASPRPGWNGKIGVWRAHKWVTVGRGNKEKGTKKGDIVLKDCTIDADLFYDLMTREDGVMRTASAQFGEHEPDCEEVICQMDGASPHTGKDMINRLNVFGATLTPRIKVVKQPPHSPDTNLLDLALFRALAVANFKARRCMSDKLFDKDQLMEDIVETFDNYDDLTLQEMWEYKRWIIKTILEEDGAIDYDRHRPKDEK